MAHGSDRSDQNDTGASRWRLRNMGFDIGPLLTAVAFSIPIIVSDLRRLRIPDGLSIGGTLCVLSLSALTGFHTLASAAVGCAVAGALLLAVRIMMGSKLGWGDVKYAMLIGSSLGAFGFYLAMLIACMVALAWFGIGYLCLPRDQRAQSLRRRVPFAPFMLSGMVLTVLGGPLWSVV